MTTMLRIADWEHLTNQLILSPVRLNLARTQPGHADGAAGSVACPTGSAAETWTRLARKSREDGAPVFEWATSSTLLGVTTAQLESEFLAAGRKQARDRGATSQIVLGPHSGELHGEDYQSWLPFAQEINRGGLRAAAFCNPGLAVAHLARIVLLGSHIAYDDRRQMVEVSSDTDTLEFAADIVASIGLLQGTFPEQAVALAAETGLERLKRIGELKATLAPIGGGEMRFHGETPVIEINGRLVYDVKGRGLLEGGVFDDRHIEAIVRAAKDPLSPTCTCGNEPWPSRILRPRSNVYSFPAGAGPQEFLYSHLGERHCVIYEMACPHASRRPQLSDWIRGGWDWSRCDRAWAERPLLSDVQIASSSDWSSQVGIAWGLEISALTSSHVHLAALASTLGFAGERWLTVFVPHANVVLLTDEPINSESAACAFMADALEAMELQEGLPLGPPVDYLTRTRAAASPPLEAAVSTLQIPIPAFAALSGIGE